MLHRTQFILLGFLAAATSAVPFKDVGNHLTRRMDPELDDLRNGNPPSTWVWRADERNFDQIKAAGGFFPFEKEKYDYSVYRYVEGKTGAAMTDPKVGSPYVSFTYTEEFAREFAKGSDTIMPPITIYKTAPGPQMMSVTEILDSVGANDDDWKNLPDDIQEDQKEILAAGGAKTEQVKEYYTLNRRYDEENFKWIWYEVEGSRKTNPDFNDAKYPQRISPPDYKLAGFPEGHKALSDPKFQGSDADCNGKIFKPAPPLPGKRGVFRPRPDDAPNSPPAGRPVQGDKDPQGPPPALGRPNANKDKDGPNGGTCRARMAKRAFEEFMEDLQRRGF